MHRIAVLLIVSFCVLPRASALPSFARQTGQKCGACHVGGDWPQLTPWGRFFKLSGYTAGSNLVNKEGKLHLPLGLFGQAGATWQSQSSDSLNGSPEAYQFTGELATKITNFLGVFYEYQLGHTFPGWKGTTGAVDVRATHFFELGGHEVLAGIDSNNNPSVQDVWNSAPDWNYPFYSSPQAPGALASPVISSLGSQVGSIGGYAVVDRQFYVEMSFYRAATGPLKWMSAGTSFAGGDATYVSGSNPYWRGYWTHEHGAHSVMAGTFGMRAHVFPDSAQPEGPTDTFTDYGFDSQYQYLADTRKLTLRGSYIYETRDWNASFPGGAVGTAQGNLKALNLNGSFTRGDGWVFHAGYLLTNGSRDATLYGVSSANGEQVTASPETTGYSLGIDRRITQNVQLMAQYRGFLRYGGVRHDVDGMGRNASDNNTLWLSLFFAF